MKKYFSIAKGFFSVILITMTMNVKSQEVSFAGWYDDANFLLQDYSGEDNFKKVNVKTGKSTSFVKPESQVEKFKKSLFEKVPTKNRIVYGSDMLSAIVVKDNDLWYFKNEEEGLVRLTNDAVPEVNARFSPDDSRIAYTKNRDLYVYDIDKKEERRLTFDASDKVYNGYAAWVYMEEILGRASRYAAFWWSPDGTKIAFLRTDETDVPVFTLNRLDQADGVHGKLEVVPYPKAGDANPKVKMGVADIQSGKITWVKTDYSVDQYIAWPFWTPDSKKLAVQILNREQNDLRFILADPVTGDYGEIYREQNDTWVEFREDVKVLKDGSGFIVRSYRSGWENLYYYGWDGTLKSQLTDFDFRVTSIANVDEANKKVYFYATGAESTDEHFYRVDLTGKHLLQITRGKGGMHKVHVSPKGTYFIDIWNSLVSAGSIIAYNKKGEEMREIYKFRQPEFDASTCQRHEMVKIKTADGLFDMPAIISYPLNFNPSKKYPVVFTIYGGPDNKNVRNRWRGTSPSWFAQNDIITFTVDHRGSGQFGKRGLDYLYRCLGKWEILDYEDAVKWLREKPFVDSKRIGITGSSYGGYMTCLALTKGADYWTHGFAGSSVTDYRLYDNVYTERFMDKPQDNKEGYDQGSALTFVDNFKGKLYMVHGDMDDNVHLQNSIWLISKLEDAGKTFSFMLYPNGRHGWGGNKAVHSGNEQHAFWLKEFFGK